MSETSKRAPRLLSGSIIFIGVMVLLGWALDITALKSVSPGLVSMKSNTAVGLVLSGVCLWWYSAHEELSSQKKVLVTTISVTVFLIGTATLFEYLFSYNLGIDELLFKDHDEIGTSDPGRISPISAFNFSLLGVAISFLKHQRHHRVFQSLSLVILLSSFFGFTGYLLNFQNLYTFQNYTDTALHSSVAFMLVSVCIFLIYPDRGVMGIINSQTLGGTLARKLLPIAVLLPMAIAWLRMKGEEEGLYRTEFGVAIFTILTVILLFIVIWMNVLHLFRLDLKRKEVERSLQVKNEELEQTLVIIDEKEKKIRQLFEAAPDAVITIDERGIITNWNHQAEQMFGWKTEEVVGSELAETIIPEQYREAHRKGLKHFLKTGEGPVLNKPIEITAVTREGLEFPVELKISPSETGGRYMFIGFVRDITERKKAEEELKNSGERFMKIFEFSPVAKSMSEIETGKIVRINSAFEKMFKIDREDAIGRTAADLKFISKEKRAEIINTVIQQEGILTKEMKVRRADGEAIDVMASFHLIEFDQTKYMLAALVDITERAKLESELKTKAEALQNANQELESFSYSVSHDLRAPLRAVTGFSNILLEDYGEKLDDEGKRTIDTIVKNTLRMGRLIDDILAFSRLSRQEFSRYPVDMKGVFSETFAELLSNEPPDRKVKFTIDDLENTTGDRAMITQVATNLLSNALKFTRPRELAEIHVGGEIIGNDYVYFVKDNGVGFDERYKDKLFGVFQRLHKDEEFEGTGVGLANVKRIVNRHGGRIWAESQIDQGTAFYFTLPSSKTEQQKTEPAKT